MIWNPHNKALHQLLRTALRLTDSLYVVGGVVRDALIANSTGTQPISADIDLLIDQDALSVGRQVADELGWAFYPLDANRGVARLVQTKSVTEKSHVPLVCDLARFQGYTLEDDLSKRDFTINAMAFELGAIGEKSESIGTTGFPVVLIDLFGGEKDLAAGRLRPVSESSLIDDPVRMLRAMRMAVQFSLSLTDSLQEQIPALAHQITQTSWERIRDEMWKALSTQPPAQFVEDLRKYGLLQYIMPEVGALAGVSQSSPHFLDVYQHTLLAMDYSAKLLDWIYGSNEDNNDQPAFKSCVQMLTPWRRQLARHFSRIVSSGHARREWLIWHAMLHDIGKPATRTVENGKDGGVRTRFLQHERVGAELAQFRLMQMRFSSDEIDLCSVVIKAHMRPHHLHDSFAKTEISKRACYRFFRDMRRWSSSTASFDGASTTQSAAVDVLLLALADYLATSAELSKPDPDQEELTEWSRYLDHTSQLLAYAFEKSSVQPPLLDGHSLIKHFSLEPGPRIGEILEQLSEAQAVGDVTTVEEATELVKQWL